MSYKNKYCKSIKIKSIVCGVMRLLRLFILRWPAINASYAERKKKDAISMFELHAFLSRVVANGKALKKTNVFN